MISKANVEAWIADCLKANGLRGRGRVWRLKGAEVQWVVHVDRLPVGRRLGVDIGLALQTDVTPRLPTDCPVLVHLENLPWARDLAVVESLDLKSPLDPDGRRSEIEAATRRLADYLAGLLTFEAVRDAYRAGDLKAAFIHRDARAFLESSGE